MIKAKKIKPILKWSGGKTSELEIINKYLPENINDFYEPFIGGGAVWLSRDWGKMYVNDFSADLINLYKNIKLESEKFYSFIDNFNKTWLEITAITKNNNSKKLVSLYKKHKQNEISELQLNSEIEIFVNENPKINIHFDNDNSAIFLIKSLFDKLKRMKKNEEKNGDMPEEVYKKIIETGLKSGLYFFIRELYNKYLLSEKDYGFQINSAIYFIIRDLCYSGMFRFNSRGAFNVPYGGMSYNSKDFNNKIRQMKSKELINHLNKTVINQGDFYDFMSKYEPKKNDFIFLDPPYDTEFSDYDGNQFSKEDQERLADYLINKCKGKWMMVIKYTDFIYSLYDKENINILSFDKQYCVNFMNRNDREVSHIIIRNYTE